MDTVKTVTTMDNGIPVDAEQAQTIGLEHENELARTLEAHRGERHVVVLQDYPDPDAISSAYAHQLISSEFGITVDTIYSGRISHQQNIALVKLLGIELTHYEKTMDLSVYDGAIYVDNQGTTAKGIIEALEAAEVPALIVVDHHEAQNRVEAEFEDIRRVGAAATIYAEYLENGMVEMQRSRREHVVAATALMHGIITDTNNFVHAAPLDFYAAAFLQNFVDSDLLEQILSQARTKQTMENIRRALENRVTLENYSIAGIGYLRAADRDSVPQAADFLLTEENIHTAIVYGILRDNEGEMLLGSMRTTKITLDPDEFIKEVLGRDTAGNYFGGGKMSAGGFEIPIGFLAGGKQDDYQQLKWDVYDRQIKQKLFARIGVEHDG